MPDTGLNPKPEGGFLLQTVLFFNGKVTFLYKQDDFFRKIPTFASLEKRMSYEYE
jgi:hypothetical protein